MLGDQYVSNARYANSYSIGSVQTEMTNITEVQRKFACNGSFVVGFCTVLDKFGARLW